MGGKEGEEYKKCNDRNKRKSREKCGAEIGEEGLRGRKGKTILESMTQPFTLD